MSNNYLLPCDCGNSVPIGVSQAGQQVTCTCGRKLDVPSLRAIRQLPPAVDKAGDKKLSQAATWNPIKGTLFAVGTLLIIGGMSVGAYSFYVYSELAPLRPSTAAYDESIEAIDAMTAAELFEAWNAIKVHGLEEGGVSPFVIARTIAQEKLRWVYVSLLVMGIGLLAAVLPMFIGTKRT